MRRIPCTAIVMAPALLLLACAHARTPQQQEMVTRGNCADLLKAADVARAANQPELALDLSSACSQEGLAKLRAQFAYGLSLNLNSGYPLAAAHGVGEPARIAACETLLGEPAGAGIPVPS